MARIYVVDMCGSEHFNQPTIDVYEMDKTMLEEILAKGEDLAYFPSRYLSDVQPIEVIVPDLIIPV